MRQDGQELVLAPVGFAQGLGLLTGFAQQAGVFVGARGQVVALQGDLLALAV